MMSVIINSNVFQDVVTKIRRSAPLLWIVSRNANQTRIAQRVAAPLTTAVHRPHVNSEGRLMKTTVIRHLNAKIESA